jgi:hypothetical protein
MRKQFASCSVFTIHSLGHRYNTPFLDVYRPLSAHNVFSLQDKQCVAAGKDTEDSGFADVCRMIADRWNHLSTKERSRFTQMAAQDAGQYKEQMTANRFLAKR